MLFLVLAVIFYVDFGGALDVTGTSVTSDVVNNTTSPSVTTVPMTNSPPISTTFVPTSFPSTSSEQSTLTSAATTTAKPQDEWVVRNSYLNESCIVLKANIFFTFKYNTTQNKLNTATGLLKPSLDSMASGDCSSTVKQWISISFNETWVFNLTFTKKNDSYYLSEFKLKYNIHANETVYPDAMPLNGSIDDATDQLGTNKLGYMCLGKKTIYENSSIALGLTGIDVYELRLEAFRTKNTTEFDSTSYERCSEDDISNLVPIIVGACLGGLILVVLVAYLIGRKRSRRGYESV